MLVHVPATQNGWLDGHTLPQPPQLFVSLRVSVQPPQFVCPDAHGSR
jgi:hypothetical protein